MKCIFPMVNAWNSKKPIQYWRNFTPGDIPLADLNQSKLKYYEWNNDFSSWMLNLLVPIERSWSVDNQRKMIDVHSRLIQGGIEGRVIVEVQPKYQVGKYNHVEVLQIYAENSQYSPPRRVFDIYPTEYYVKFNNEVWLINEEDLTAEINKCMENQKQKPLKFKKKLWITHRSKSNKERVKESH
jgi:hypothetical protein